jgi:hypothetical protein
MIRNSKISFDLANNDRRAIAEVAFMKANDRMGGQKFTAMTSFVLRQR